jgi:hypothetical protein
VNDLAIAAPSPLSYEALKAGLRAATARDPFDTTVSTVLAASLLFYSAEKGRNPKVQTFADALVFITTCLSVGYADVFARTAAGKAIAAFVMTVGPAMTGALLDAPSRAPELLESQRAIADKLDAILEALRARRAP